MSANYVPQIGDTVLINTLDFPSVTAIIRRVVFSAYVPSLPLYVEVKINKVFCNFMMHSIKPIGLTNADFETVTTKII